MKKKKLSVIKRVKLKGGTEVQIRKRVKEEEEIIVNRETKEKLRIICKKHNLEIDAAIEQLIMFWELRYFDLLISKIKTKYDQGLTTLDVSQLGILLTLLSHIDKDIGLSYRINKRIY
jgi:hypothetical protein